MKSELKIVISGVALCIAGAVLLDIGVIPATATTLILLGVFTIMAGPMINNI